MDIKATAQDFPGEQIEQPIAEVSLSDIAAKINAKWRERADQTLEIAGLCAVAYAKLSRGHRKAFYGTLPFGRSRFAKFVSIGKGRLMQPALRDRLPPHWSSLYLLAELNDEEWSATLDAGLVNPEVKRREIEGFIAKLRPSRKKAGAAKKIGIVLSVPPDITSNQRREFEKKLGAVCDEFGVEMRS